MIAAWVIVDSSTFVPGTLASTKDLAWKTFYNEFKWDIYASAGTLEEYRAKRISQGYRAIELCELQTKADAAPDGIASVLADMREKVWHKYAEWPPSRLDLQEGWNAALDAVLAIIDEKLTEDAQ